MANMTPAINVQAAAVAAFLSPIIEHICQANGINIPPDASAALPGAVAVGVAYAIDVWSPEKANPSSSASSPSDQTNSPPHTPP